MAYSKYNRQRFEGEKPVKEGQEYALEIEATGAKGDGVGKVKGFVVIVPNTKPGQKIKVRIDAVRGKVAFGTAVGKAEEGSIPSKEPEETAAEPEVSGEEPVEELADSGEESLEEPEGQAEEPEVSGEEPVEKPKKKAPKKKKAKK